MGKLKGGLAAYVAKHGRPKLKGMKSGGVAKKSGGGKSKGKRK